MRIILEVAPEYANEIQNRFDIGEYVDAELREANTYAYPKTFRARLVGLTIDSEPFPPEQIEGKDY